MNSCCSDISHVLQITFKKVVSFFVVYHTVSFVNARLVRPKDQLHVSRIRKIWVIYMQLQCRDWVGECNNIGLTAANLIIRVIW